MAGSGTIQWATGDTVTAANFQSYVQDQVVAVYADATARDAAYGGAGEPTLAEGMVCYLKDTNEFQIYSGSAWVPLLDLDTFAVSSGAYTIKGDVTVGEDDTGHDVTFYGATSGSRLVWDSSENDLLLYGNSQIFLDNLNASDSTEWISLPESYGMYADNTGPGSASSRMWINGINGAALYIGPRSGAHTWNLIRLAATNIQLLGAVTKTSGTFDIPHPTKGEDWRLRHSFIEGPKADNIYRGTVTLDENDTTTIDLDEDSGMTDGTWEALNSNSWSMVASSGNAVTWALSGKTLTISGPDGAVCNWMVIGERKDPTVIEWDATNDEGQLITEYQDPTFGETPES